MGSSCDSAGTVADEPESADIVALGPWDALSGRAVSLTLLVAWLMQQVAFGLNPDVLRAVVPKYLLPFEQLAH